MFTRSTARRAAWLLTLGWSLAAAARAQNAPPPPASTGGWIDLVGRDGPHGWKAVPQGWEQARSAYLDAGNLKRLAFRSGQGVLLNGRSGRAPNIVTKDEFGDVELHLEFLVPAGSNSGVKLEGVYEIQIFDSYNVKRATASHSGGVYPRAELLPRYRHIDEGYPPLVNAARPLGEWQTLDITFRAPRFNAAGEKVADARFVSVILNGQIVQRDRDVPTPTGHVWRQPEHPTGPILLQGDHGPVAFRNVRVKRLAAESAN
jgi:hypothetical protein